MVESPKIHYGFIILHNEKTYIYIAHEQSEMFVFYVIHVRPLGKATPATK